MATVDLGLVKGARDGGNADTLGGKDAAYFESHIPVVDRIYINQNILMTCIEASERKLRGSFTLPCNMINTPSIENANVYWVFMGGYDTTTQGNCAFELNVVYGHSVDVTITLPAHISPVLGSTYYTALEMTLNATSP